LTMRKKSNKEGKILEAAIKVFSKKGYDLASIDEISRKARVSKGIVFFYYKKKENLIERAALESVPIDEIKAANDRDHKNPTELLFDFGISFLKKYESEELRNLLLMTIANKERHKQINLALRSICFQEMNRMFAKVESLLGVSVPVPLRRAFFGSLLCYVIWWSDNDASPEQYVKTLTTGILESLKNTTKAI
ncbi:MAG: TetR/AcrR family transcriptional regulator, partial [Thermoplasmatales archaeon]